MGQNASRHHRHRDTPSINLVSHQENVQTDASTPHADPNVPNVPESSPNSHRSLRKSILNIVRPSSRSSSAHEVRTKHRSWSKRWSTVPPPQADVTPPASSTTSPSESQTPDLSTSTAPTTPVPEKASIDGQTVDTEGLMAEVPEVREPSVRPDSDHQHPSSPFLPTLTDSSSPDSSEDAVRVDHGVSQNIGAWLNAQGSQQLVADDRAEEVAVGLEQSDSAPEHQETIPEPAAETPAQPIGVASEPSPTAADDPSATLQTPGRTFPPPGTLVVVQGVVHTTDVPARLPSPDTQDATRRSSSTPPNTSGRRGRLSALLHSRPSSMIASRAPATDASSLAPPASTVGDTAASSNNHLPVSATNSQSNFTSQLETADAPVQEGSNQPTEATAPVAEEPGAISSSSIDILGTLLSVAAAATAASLLTGSSEPIMSSGLAPPAYNPDGATGLPADPWLSRPTSPTPTAGLGMGMGMNTDNTRSERLRNAWGSIRERLGLRPSPSPTSSGSNGESNVLPILASNDPREMMMAQMARAFNLGFGMGGGEGSNSGSSEISGSEDTGDSTIPPEGSFERFLVDLQADLRVTLTSPGGLGGDAGNAPQTQQPLAAAPEEASASTSSDPFPQSHTNSPRQVFAAPIISDDDTEDESEDPMPELESISDSDSESQDAHEDEQGPDMLSFDPVNVPAFTAESGPSRTAQAPIDNDNNRSADSGVGGGTEALAPGQAAVGPADGSASNTQTGGTAPRRINWWRLYRFPPITAPRTHGAAGVASTTASPLGLNTFSAPPSPLLNPDPTPPLPEMDPILAELPFANTDEVNEPPPLPVHMVVPVIVVGLQSVNAANIMQQQPGAPDDGENSMDGEGDEDGDTEGSNSGSRQTEENGRSGGAGRGRPWRIRAAEAIRNLRPGRRNRVAPATLLPGRTFLIYVIGGYYPPDHSIVTGGPSSLDSFEALLELAELLGQVKPPTVTREDIEKSGLEVIKPSQLEQYAKENKIASNCIDRCLICLDDYQPEDNIRLMNCRHGFHKSCVDKWLETGRNNCPACRSKGVSMETPLSAG